jgi:thiamine-monophosphate kinase
MGEFDLIERFFKRPAQLAQLTNPSADIALGVGDDCALLELGPNEQLAVSTDLLIEGRHFFANVNPRSLGHKSLAVNLSDLAAMGAKPLAFTLALSLPTIEENWLAEFSKGLLELADLYQCPLVGGDTTSGPLSICITVMGKVAKGEALKRSGAKIGDDIYITGALGWARLGLHCLQNQLAFEISSEERNKAILALEKPKPRIQTGIAIRPFASAALDLSDGLSGDIQHILKASQVGAVLFEDQLAKCWEACDYKQHLSTQQQAQWVLAGGDDYELCFTAPAQHRLALDNLRQQHPELPNMQRIGQITAGHQLLLLPYDKAMVAAVPIASSGFDHFAN